MYAILIEMCRFSPCYLIDNVENFVGTVARYHLPIRRAAHFRERPPRLPLLPQVLTTFEENVRYATYLLYFYKLKRRRRKLTWALVPRL